MARPAPEIWFNSLGKQNYPHEDDQYLTDVLLQTFFDVRGGHSLPSICHD